MAKSVLLQNQWLEWRWSFANVLMWVGKKAAGKKNKFGVGKVLEFCGLSFKSVLFLKTLIFATELGALHITFWGFEKWRIRKPKLSILH